jgi:glyoxalase family protein
MRLNGFHHLTAVTADAPRNHAFYTELLGLRLVKKSVNQDDVRAYHLFYADGKGSPGTDITFFDWPAPRERRGTHSICRTGFRIKGEKAFSYWADRLKASGVSFTDASAKLGRMTLDFEDFEGQRLSLVADESDTPFALWEKSPVPAEHQIHGLGPITLSVPDVAPTEAVLQPPSASAVTRWMLPRPKRWQTSFTPTFTKAIDFPSLDQSGWFAGCVASPVPAMEPTFLVFDPSKSIRL